MTRPRINFSHDEFAALCRRHGIRRVAFFGSVLRDESEFSAFFGGRPVDFVNPKYLNRRLRDRVLASAEVVYAA
jgi:predicted nucleotidyltransferase